MRRVVDVAAAGLALTALAVPMALVAMVLRLTGEGRVLYRQERVGLGGRTFHVLKFTTMREGSDPLDAPGYTVEGDPRVLPVGRLLRKAKINELPQFVNVLKGDMTLVGWRPVSPRSFADYSPTIQRKLLQARPGVTGVGSLVFRDEEALVSRAQALGRAPGDCYLQDIKPYKGAVEAWYQDHRSLLLDLRILVATALSVALPRRLDVRAWLPGLPPPRSGFVLDHMSGKS